VEPSNWSNILEEPIKCSRKIMRCF
jgi:hypothetical protein